MASTWTATSTPVRDLIVGTGSLRWAIIVETDFSPAKGGLPASISYSRTPTE